LTVAPILLTAGSSSLQTAALAGLGVIGLLPTYATLGIGAPVLLLLLRILQGVAIGGEVLGAWVFLSEHVDPSHVGLACGVLTGGILLGSLVATGLSLAMTQDPLRHHWPARCQGHTGRP
jgi:MFS family permease